MSIHGTEEHPIYEAIRKELAVIVNHSKQLGLIGEMRLFSPHNRDNWNSQDLGTDLWFEAHQVHEVVERISMIYKEGKPPNTALFLDPIVYERRRSGMKPLGTAIAWTTILDVEGQEIDPRIMVRLETLDLHIEPIMRKSATEMQPISGYKILAFLKAPTLIEEGELGQITDACQAIADLADIPNTDVNYKYYMLSGMAYRDRNNALYRQADFADFFPDKEIPKYGEDILNFTTHEQFILDAATCFNAYDRMHIMYERYGADKANLERNIASLSASNSRVASTVNEIKLIFRSHRRLGLEDGFMRLFTDPSQDLWRARDQGIEIWFTEDDISELLEKIQFFYNGGVLPNSPLFIDPVLYDKVDDNYVPRASSIVWASCLYTGEHVYNLEAAERVESINIYHSDILRAGEDLSGMKLIGFLDEPYYFSDDEKQQVLEQRKNIKENYDMPDLNEMDAIYQTIDFGTHPALTFPANAALAEIVDANAVEFSPYYMSTGQEYLCSNGAFSNEESNTTQDFDEDKLDAFVKSYGISAQHLLDAGECWRSYDKHHILWKRFGVDMENLPKNLEYFDLCGRDLSLLDMTGEAREDIGEQFEFFVPGWIPKAAITVIAATGGTGKSSIAHRLAVLASIDWKDDEPNPKWLGNELDKENCKGLAVYFSGEDSAAIVNARAEMFDPEGRSSRLMLKTSNDFGTTDDGDEMHIGNFLNYLHKLPKVSVLVIDPARKYLLGDEEDSEVVSNFFEAIERFSIEKNCPVIVVHHLKKEAHPTHTSQMLDLLRGSQVFIDRPRVVIGLLRDGPLTVAGLSKNNIPPKMGMVEGERLFERDAKNLDLIWLGEEDGVRD